MGLGQARLCLLQPLKREMKSFIFFFALVLWAWHLCLFTHFIFRWNESSLWGRGQKIPLPLHTAPSTSKHTLLFCIHFASRIQRLFKLLVQAE